MIVIPPIPITTSNLVSSTVAEPKTAAIWAVTNQGRLYDWQLILGFLAWCIPNKRSRVVCSEACAEMLGLRDAHRFDPCTLQAVVKAMKVWKC